MKSSIIGTHIHMTGTSDSRGVPTTALRAPPPPPSSCLRSDTPELANTRLGKTRRLNRDWLAVKPEQLALPCRDLITITGKEIGTLSVSAGFKSGLTCVRSRAPLVEVSVVGHLRLHAGAPEMVATREECWGCSTH